MRCVRASPAVLLVWLATTAAAAHEVRPGYLEIHQISSNSFDVLWKVPANGEYRLGLHVSLPRECSGASQEGSFVRAAFIERWRTTCPAGLAGKTIAIDGLSGTRTDVLARLERLDGTTQTVRLTPAQTSFVVTAGVDTLEVVRTYFILGVGHILTGVDHLLFVLGLMFVVGSWQRLIATVTAFTVAHSITLAAATLGLLHVAQAPVEATIALSVMLVAGEVLHDTRGQTRFAARAPWIVAFVFGLLHGLGFAGALREVGLPERDIPLALLCFNVGVEAGQVLFIAAVVAALLLVTRVLANRHAADDGLRRPEAAIRTPVAYAVGSVAAFWLVQRVMAFWP